MHIEMVNALLDQGNDAHEDTNLPDTLSREHKKQLKNHFEAITKVPSCVCFLPVRLAHVRKVGQHDPCREHHGQGAVPRVPCLRVLHHQAAARGAAKHDHLPVRDGQRRLKGMGLQLLQDQIRAR